MPPLLRLLAELRHLSLGHTWVRLAWAGGTSAVGLAVAALGLATWGRPYWGAALVHVAGAAGALAAGLALAARAWHRVTPRPLASVAAAHKAARMAARLTPKLSTAVPTALALWQAQPLLPAGELACAHVTATLAAFETARPKVSLAEAAQARLRPWRRACARLAGICALLAVLQAEQVAELWAILQHRQPSVRSHVPIVGDLALRITPPAYTGLPPALLPVADGQVRALQGSGVEVSGRTGEPFADGVLCVTQGISQARPLAADAQVPGLWHGRFEIEQSGTYSFGFTNSQGVQVRDSVDYGITVVEDASPSVTLFAPTADVVMRDNDSMPLHWRACDDLGLSGVRLHIEPLDGTAAWDLPLTPQQRGPKEAHPQSLGPGVCQSGKMDLSSRDLRLAPGPGLRLSVVAEDTYPAPGPNLGTSVTQTVSLFSARAHHEALLGQEQAALDALVDWLALELTLRAGPPHAGPSVQSPLAALAAQVTTVHGQLTTLAQALDDDALAADGERLAFAHVREHAATADAELHAAMPQLEKMPWPRQADAWEAPSSWHRRRVRVLERDIIYLDQLLAQGRLEILHDTAQDLLSAKAELQDLLAQYKRHPDGALRAQIAARMAALKTQMRSMMHKMGELRPGLPQGFHNAEAEAHSRWDETLNRIDTALAHDDVDDVARDLEHLANMVDDVVDEISEQQAQDAQSQHGAVRAQMAQVAQALSKLEIAQTALQAQSQRLAHQGAQAAAGPEPQAHERRIQEAATHLAQAQRAVAALLGRPPAGLLGPNARRLQAHLADVQQMLHDGELARAVARIAEASDVAQQLQGRAQQQLRPQYLPASERPAAAAAISDAQRAAKEVAQAHQALDALLRGAMGPLPKSLQKQAQAQGLAQDALAQEAQRTADALSKLAQEGPLVGAQGSAQMQHAQAQMRAAAQALAAGGMEAAGQHQHEAKEALQQLRAALQAGASEGSAPASGRKPQGPGGRKPGPGLPQPMGRPRPNTGPSLHVGMDGKDAVQIPTGSPSAGPDYRQQLLQAAKQAPPLHYEEAARRYHDELIR